MSDPAPDNSTPIPPIREFNDRAMRWLLEWCDYVSEDRLSLALEGGSSEFDSAGLGPALTACDWSLAQEGRGLRLHLQPEHARDIEAGHHVELRMTLRNSGKRMEVGVFQMVLPPGVRVSGPETNATQVFAWEVGPGEEITQPVVVQVEPAFDASAFWYLNYRSLPVSVETFWDGHRALLSASLPMAVPPAPLILCFPRLRTLLLPATHAEVGGGWRNIRFVSLPRFLPLATGRRMSDPPWLGGPRRNL